MDQDRSLTPSEIEEVRRWLSVVRSGAPEAQARAASELGRLGVWTRSSIRTRGSVATSAANRLPEKSELTALMSVLNSTDIRVRCQVVRALGEWGGEEAARAVFELLQSEGDADVRLYCVTALRTIGGPDAVEALRQLVDSGADSERDLALSALEELATGGQFEDTEAALSGASASVPVDTSSPAHTRGAPHAEIRVRGAIRTRGAPSRPPSVPPETVGQTLHRIQNDNKAASYLRLRAGAVAKVLGSS